MFGLLVGDLVLRAHQHPARPVRVAGYLIQYFAFIFLCVRVFIVTSVDECLSSISVYCLLVFTLLVFIVS